MPPIHARARPHAQEEYGDYHAFPGGACCQRVCRLPTFPDKRLRRVLAGISVLALVMAVGGMYTSTLVENNPGSIHIFTVHGFQVRRCSKI